MISIKHTEGVAFIELNAPPVNALGLKMRQALSSAIHELDADEQVKAIVLCRRAEGIQFLLFFSVGDLLLFLVGFGLE